MKHYQAHLAQPNKYKRSLLALLFIALMLTVIFIIFRPVGAVTDTVRPDGDIARVWAACTGTGCSTAHYTTVDEASNSTADYINTGLSGSGGEDDQFSMTSVAGATNGVTSVAVTIYAHSQGGCQSDCDTVTVNVSIDGATQTGQDCTMTATNTICTRTFNGSWQGDDDLEVILTRNVLGSGSPSGRDDDVQVTYVAADVTYEINFAPSAPTLIAPSDSASKTSITPTFQLRSSDANNDYLRYRIEVCSTSNCSSVVRTIDQPSSQTGWSGQDTQTNTAYVGNATLSSSTIANHTYQSPPLSYSTQYWWRAYAIDPGGTNTLSSASSISSFTTENQPSAPTLISPVNSATAQSINPVFEFRSSEADNDYLQYRIQVCSTSNCSAVVRTIDQTSSQTGWSGQDTQTNTAYVGNATLSSSTIATHNYQDTPLSYSTQYWWRAAAIDPGGSNVFGSYSSINDFTTDAPPPIIPTVLQGGLNITGGTTIN